MERHVRLILISCLLSLSLLSGCIVNSADRFQIGGEVRIETTGILDYVTGFRLRVFGGILLEKRRTKEKSDEQNSESLLPLDAFLTDIGK